MEKSKKIWLIVAGIILIALGVLCICFPAETIFTTTWIIGCFTLFAGIAKMIFTLKTQLVLPNSGTRMLSSLMQIIIGIFFLCNNLFVAMSLPVAFALWVMIEGIAIAIQSFDYKHVGFGNWWLLLVMGIAVAVLGCLGLKYYDITSRTISTLIGIGIIAIGGAYLLAYTGINRFEKGMKDVRDSLNA